MNKSEILQAAFAAWGRDGYKRLSLTQVALELGVTKPALYRHYPNKQALLDGMYEDFFDRFGEHLRIALADIARIPDEPGRVMSLVRILSDYFSHHKDDFIFTLAQVVGNPDPCRGIYQALEARGLLMPGGSIGEFGNRGDCDRGDRDRGDRDQGDRSDRGPLVRFATLTVFFLIALFYMKRSDSAQGAPEADIAQLGENIRQRVFYGLGFAGPDILAMDFEGLERRGRLTPEEGQGDSQLLRAVAQAVAEEGPWNASMELVARRSGLSKSGLYAHFKNKKEMLQSLFQSEFERIGGIMQSKVLQVERPEERLYVILVVLAEYLRSRSDVLAALDWIRIQRLDLGPLVPLPLFRLFSFPGVSAADRSGKVPVRDTGKAQGAGDAGEETVSTARWVLFLTVNLLMEEKNISLSAALAKERLRALFTYMTLGVEGWYQDENQCSES